MSFRPTVQRRRRPRPSGPRAATPLALLTIVSLGVCCRSAPVPGGEVVIAQITSAATLDPHRHDEVSTLSTLSHFYDTLVAFGPEMDIQPSLATRWENPSDTVWRFELRPGVVFHDGRPLGPPDVVASLKRAMTLPDSGVRHYLAAVSEVRAIDKETVEIVARHPAPVLLNKLAFVPIVPRDQGAAPITRPNGTGPYRFLSGSPEATIRGERFLRYWGPPPAFDRVTVLSLPDARQRAEAVPAGRAHLVARFPEEHWEWGRQQPSVRMTSREGLSVTLLAFSLRPRSPFADPRVRRAAALALDRDRLVERAGGLAVPMDQVVPRGVFGYTPGLGPMRHDRAEAMRLLKEAGQSGGFETPFLLPDSQESLGRDVAAQLAAVGIRLHATVLPWGGFSERLSREENTVVLFGWAAVTGDASDALDALLHSPGGGYGSGNRFSYANSELDRLIETSGRTLDPRLRRKLLGQAMAIVREDLPVVPLLARFQLYAVARDLDWTPRLDRRAVAQDVRPGSLR